MNNQEGTSETNASNLSSRGTIENLPVGVCLVLPAVLLIHCSGSRSLTASLAHTCHCILRIENQTRGIDVFDSFIFVAFAFRGNDLSDLPNNLTGITKCACIAADCLGFKMLDKSRSVDENTEASLACDFFVVLMNWRQQVLDESGNRLLVFALDGMWAFVFLGIFVVIPSRIEVGIFRVVLSVHRLWRCVVDGKALQKCGRRCNCRSISEEGCTGWTL